MEGLDSSVVGDREGADAARGLGAGGAVVRIGGLGGPIGRGAQWMPLVALDDAVGAIRHLLDTPGLSGPFNVSSPTPVTNAEFASTLGRVLGRPSFVPTPASVVRFALGELADALILGGQRVVPTRAMALGYEFTHETLESALRDIYERRV